MDDPNEFSAYLRARLKAARARLDKELQEGGSRPEADLSLEERAEIRALLAEASKMAERSEKYTKDLLRDLGVRTNLDAEGEYVLQLWAAARHAGFSTEEFWRLTLRELCAVLELKVREREAHAGTPVRSLIVGPGADAIPKAKDPASVQRKARKLDAELIAKWMEDEGFNNNDLATALAITPRAVSSLRNSGNYHGDGAVTKLANLMKRDVQDLFLP